MRCIWINDQTAHENLGVDDAKEIIIFRKDVVKAVEREHVSCTTPQFAAWYKSLVREVGEVVSEIMSRSEKKSDSINKNWLTLVAEAGPLLYTRGSGRYYQHSAA